MTALTWYLAYSKPRLEQLAQQNLQRQGYQCFLPLIAKQKLIRGKARIVNEPLFGRYLFVRTDPAEGRGLGPVRSTPGMSGLVMFNGQPQQVPDALIDAITRRLTLADSEPQSLFNPGDKVRIVEGSFQGLEAIYAADAAEDRAYLLLDLLGKTNKLSFQLSQLKHA